jgi:hypothetical protein
MFQKIELLILLHVLKSWLGNSVPRKPGCAGLGVSGAAIWLVWAIRGEAVLEKVP